MGIWNKINNFVLFIFDDFRKNLGRKFGGEKGVSGYLFHFFHNHLRKIDFGFRG